MSSAPMGEGVRGRGDSRVAARNPADFAPTRETSSTNLSLGGLITCILRMIVVLAPYESQMGCLNHTYFTHDGALGRFHVAVGSVICPIWVAPIICILRMIVHMGV